ncbi:MAG TPA: hypothetical protein VMQ44_01135 [Candidatus Saccharimonadales bacterium]|nr:hypothetical protein [Candidatus Saccharimonadales bacterium]
MEAKTKGLDAFFERIFVTKAPYQLPENVREWIVKYSPWISLVLVIILLPAIVAGLGLGAVLGGLSFIGGVSTGMFFWFGFILGVVQLVLLLMALPGLFKRKLSAWRLIYYSALIAIASSIVTNLGYMTIGSLIWALVWDAVELYFLFQIKSKYA